MTENYYSISLRRIEVGCVFPSFDSMCHAPYVLLVAQSDISMLVLFLHHY